MIRANGGIVRKVDKLGRVVIPMEIRKQLNVAVGDDMVIAQCDNSVVISKYSDTCLFCGSMDGVQLYKGVFICRKCINKIRSGAGKERYEDEYSDDNERHGKMGDMDRRQQSKKYSGGIGENGSMREGESEKPRKDYFNDRSIGERIREDRKRRQSKKYAGGKR